MISAALRYNAGLIRANGLALPVAAGATSTQLVDRQGNPIRADKLRRLDAIHQTDWQGRVRLSNQPRAQWVRNTTIDPANSQWSAANTSVSLAAAAALDPLGSMAMARVAVVDSSSPAAKQINGVTFTGQLPADAAQLYVSIIVRRDGTAGAIAFSGFGNGGSGVGFDPKSGEYSINSQWDDAGVDLLNGDFARCWATVTPANWPPPQTAFTPKLYNTPTGGNAPNGAYLDVGFPQLLFASDKGAFIPSAYPDNSAHPVITDYTLSGSQITLGQGAGEGATYDWTGLARR